MSVSPRKTHSFFALFPPSPFLLFRWKFGGTASVEGHLTKACETAGHAQKIKFPERSHVSRREETRPLDPLVSLAPQMIPAGLPLETSIHSHKVEDGSLIVPRSFSLPRDPLHRYPCSTGWNRPGTSQLERGTSSNWRSDFLQMQGEQKVSIQSRSGATECNLLGWQPVGRPHVASVHRE